MANTTYQVILSTDGKHTVIVTSDDPQALSDASDWAQTTYERFVQRYGLKGEQRQRNGDASQQPQAPLCAVHRLPMVWVDKNGGFWSCHEKDQFGDWCSFRPGKRT